MSFEGEAFDDQLLKDDTEPNSVDDSVDDTEPNSVDEFEPLFKGYEQSTRHAERAEQLLKARQAIAMMWFNKHLFNDEIFKTFESFEILEESGSCGGSCGETTLDESLKELQIMLAPLPLVHKHRMKVLKPLLDVIVSYIEAAREKEAAETVETPMSLEKKRSEQSEQRSERPKKQEERCHFRNRCNGSEAAQESICLTRVQVKKMRLRLPATWRRTPLLPTFA